MTFRNFNAFVKAADEPTDLQRIEAFRALILHLPRENLTLLARLLAFLRRVINKGKSDGKPNGLTAAAIANVYGPLILREPQIAGTEQSPPVPVQVVKVPSICPLF